MSLFTESAWGSGRCMNICRHGMVQDTDSLGTAPGSWPSARDPHALPQSVFIAQQMVHHCLLSQVYPETNVMVGDPHAYVRRPQRPQNYGSHGHIQTLPTALHHQPAKNGSSLTSPSSSSQVLIPITSCTKNCLRVCLQKTQLVTAHN